MRKPVRSINDLKEALNRDLSQRAEGIAGALALGSVEEIKKTSLMRVAPSYEVKRDGKKVITTVFIPSADKAVANAAMAEEVLGTRPFATLANKLQSKAAALKILTGQGIS